MDVIKNEHGTEIVQCGEAVLTFIPRGLLRPCSVPSRHSACVPWRGLVCVHLCVCVYVCVCVCVSVYATVCVPMSVYMLLCVYVHVCVYVTVCVCSSVCQCYCVCLCVCYCVYVCVCMCTCLCVCYCVCVSLLLCMYVSVGFPSKESTCNAGDPGLIPGLGRSPGEGIGYPLQFSWASLVAQTVKNPPAMRETRV